MTQKPLVFPLFLFLLLLIFNFSAGAENSISVTVKQRVNQSWLVKYQLPKAVSKVIFYRPGDLARDSWNIKSKDLQWHRNKNNQQFLQSKSGKTFDSFELKFDSNFNHLNKDYELNQRFSDGGLTLYTGHLLLSLGDDKKTAHQFEFLPLKNHHSIVKGLVSSHSQQWLDTGLQGTYVYFGKTTPLSNDKMVSVLDQELPLWLHQRMTKDLPSIFDFFSETFDLKLDERPMILFSYQKTNEPITEYSGGALPGVIQLSLNGKHWQNESSENLSGFLHFIAHEAAHLWNSQMIMLSGEVTDSWIHEGSAEYMAIKVLQYLGIHSAKQVQLENEKYLNQCLANLNQNALKDFESHKNFSAFYSCGAVIAWLSELAIQSQDPDQNIFSFWKAMIHQVRSNHMQLDETVYFNSLKALSDNNELHSLLQELLSSAQQQPIDFFKTLTQAVEVKLDTDHNHPQMARTALHETLKHMMILDCKQYTFMDRGNYYEIGQAPNCKTLKPGMRITKIENFSLNQGHQIFQSSKQKCADNDSIQFETTDQQKLSISCQRLMIHLPPWLVVSSN